MKIIKILFILFFMGLPFQKMKAQDAWVISTKNPSASEYYGITAANGVIGIVSSPEPLKIKEVVLAGVYDMFGRGRVSNFLPSFNLLNMQLMIGEEKIERALKRYLDDLSKDSSWRKPQNGSTFFNSGYVDYLDENYEKPPEPKPQRNPASILECERDYDFDNLEQQLLEKQFGGNT